MKCLRIILLALLAVGMMATYPLLVLAQEQQKEQVEEAEVGVPPETSVTAETTEPAETAEIRALAGEVASVDLENSLLVVKYLKDEAAQLYENATVYVDDSTVIEKNQEMITLGEVAPTDKVSVEYTTDSAGKNTATYIMVGITESSQQE